VNPVREVPRVDTGGDAQWGLNVIKPLELAGEYLPEPVKHEDRQAEYHWPQATSLPHIAASRNEWWRFSAVVGGESKAAGGLTIRRRIVNLPTIRRGRRRR